MNPCSKSISRAVLRSLIAISLVGALCSSMVAGSRTSTSYSILVDTIDGGGRRAASVSYSSDGSLGNVGGVSTATAPVTTLMSGYIAQLSETRPVITSALTASGTTGGAIATYTIVAENLPGSFSATGLPAGLTINTNTGAIAGTPTAAGTFNVTIGASNSAGTGTATLVLTIAVRSYAGNYFGTFGAAGGTWALSIGPNNTGTFIAYLSAQQQAIVTPVTIAADGSFSTNVTFASGSSAAAFAATTLSGAISATGVISAQLAGDVSTSLSGTADATTGPAQNLAGFYSAAALNAASGTTYAIVGASGQAVVLVVTPTFVTGGTGTVAANGQLNVTLAQSAQSDASIGTTNGSFSAAITPAGASAPLNFAGLAASVVPINHLANLSTRGSVGTGDSIMIAGFVLSGSGTQRVLVRAVGPTLGDAPFGVPGVIPDPVLVVKNGASTVATSDNWGDTGSATALTDAMTQTGAFPIPTGSKDAALLLDLTAGNYTALVSGVSDSIGVAIVEAYTVDASTNSADARLVNISTRGFVGAGDAIMIPGFVVQGNAPRRVLVRAVGPTLGGAPFNVAGVIADPVLNVFVSGTSSPVATNDDWDINGAGDAIVAAAAQVFAFELPRGSKDAVIILTIPPNTPYTIQVSGKSGATGVAIAEVYELP